MELPEVVRAHLTHSDVPRESRLLHGLHRQCLIFHGGGRVDAMQVVQVHVVNAKPFAACLGRLDGCFGCYCVAVQGWEVFSGDLVFFSKR